MSSVSRTAQDDHIAAPADGDRIRRRGVRHPRDTSRAGERVRLRARPHASADRESIIPGAGWLTVEEGPLKGGELNAAVTSALVGIHTEYLGRGPKRASTFHYGNVLVMLMHDVLTHADRSLARTNRCDAVRHIRQLYQETMEADFCAAVERLSGQKVIAFISGNQIEPDIAAEVFILDAPP